MKTKSKILLSILSIFFTIFVLEIGIRLYEFASKKIPFSQSLSDYEDNVYGWKGKSILDEFREGKKRVFIIGDSFTNGTGINEADIYYSVLKQNLDADFFICSGDGYGTTQELLVLKNYISSIRPDLIIVQITNNDIINNNFNLDKKSYFHNSRLLRPYFINGHFQLLYPSKLGLVRYFFERDSRFFYRFFNKIDSINLFLVNKGIIKMADISSLESIDFIKDYRESLLVTEQLIDNIISLSKGIPIVFLPANDSDCDFYSLFKVKADNRNIYYIDEPVIDVSKRMLLEDVLSEDKVHWNELGNKYFGEELLQSLIERSIVPEIVPILNN